MKSPIALLRSLLNDFRRLNPGVKGLDRDIITIEKRFEDEGYGFLTVALPTLGKSLQRGLSEGRFTCPPGFKTIRKGSIPRLFSGMTSKVFDPLTGLLEDDTDFGVLRDLYQILMFFKKTQLSPENEEFLHQKAVNEFYQCDDTASRVVIPDRHDHLIGRVCKLLLNTLNSKDVENATYKHGPGAVKEGISANQKWEALISGISDDPEFLCKYGQWTGDDSHQYTDHAFASEDPDRGSPRHTRTGRDWRKVLNKVRPTHVGGPPSSQSARISSFLRPVRLRGRLTFDRASRGSAKLISVPKNSTSRRTITVEPVLNQFVQQGLNILLRESITECRILRNCLALSDQSLNQKLALEGSQFDNWATIDLKSASDLLSTTLVRSVFRHQIQFLEYMMDCRSPSIECPGKPGIDLGKFAGMGNALTFPVQSVCFAVVCIAAILDSQGVNPTYWNVRRASRCIRIYGDDIIVKRKHAHQCVNWLTAVGLKVNDSKSFLIGNFKESCGVDAFRGVDITPLYIKHRPDQLDASPSVIAGFVSLSNSCWLSGLYETGTWLREYVEELLGKSLPLVSQQSGSLGWHTRLDAVSPHKWCRYTHRFLTRTLALAPIKKDDKLDGYAALLKCLSSARVDQSLNSDGTQKDRSKVLRNLFPEPLALDLDHLSKTTIRYKSRLVRRWVPSLTRAG